MRRPPLTMAAAAARKPAGRPKCPGRSRWLRFRSWPQFGGIKRTGGFRQFGLDRLEQAHIGQECALARRHRSAARSGRCRCWRTSARISRAASVAGMCSASWMVYLPILIALADRQASHPGRDRVVLERQREGEDLEHRTQLVDVLRHDVAGGVAAAEIARVGIEIGQRHQRQRFAGIARPSRSRRRRAPELGHARRRFMLQDVLHAHVERGLDRAPAAQLADRGRVPAPRRPCRPAVAAATAPTAAQTLVAVARFSAGNSASTSPSDAGMSAAPPTPWTTRAAISIAALDAEPAMADPRRNNAKPTKKTRCRPTRSAMRPAGTSSAATITL